VKGGKEKENDKNKEREIADDINRGIVT